MKIKKISVFFVMIIIVLNILLVCSYFKYYVYPQIKHETTQVQSKINRNLLELIKNLEKFNNIDDAIKDYQINHKSSIYIENADGNVIYNNSDIWDSKLNYYMSKIVNINGTPYLIKLFEQKNWDNLSSINNFILFEIIVVLCIIFIMYEATHTKFIKPLDKIQTSIKNYKFGIKPKRIQVHNEFDLIQNNFVDLVDSLEEEKNNQRRIITSISHDIKTPVTSILGYSDRLIQANIDDKTKEKYINIIYQKALSLKEITDDFEEYLYENNNDSLKLEKTKLSDLKKYLLVDYKVDLKDKNIDFKIDFKDLKKEINIDLNKIKRVFSNIISNSVRYLNKGGIIKISCEDLLDFYKFIISDNGVGCKEEDIKKIFEPLYTTDKSRKISGLGLSICKEIITMHQGNIRAYNNEIGGLTIEFTIKK